MFDEMSATQVWLLVSMVAIAAFIAGRLSVNVSPDVLARYKRIAEEEAALNFARLSAATQAEVDRLAAAGKTVDAVKLIRASLNTGLYEAKQIIDQRKRSAASRRLDH